MFRKRKSWLILFGILLPLLLTELGLRLVGYGMVRPELNFGVNMRSGLEAGRLELDRQVFWREAGGPPTQMHERLRLIRVGDPVPPKGDKYRIICLGDSCTRLSRQGWPYSLLLQEGLGLAYVEVFNASLEGYSSHQGLAWLRHHLLAYEPDLVIVYFGWNDHWRSTGRTDAEYAASLSTSHLRLFDLFRSQPDESPLRVSIDEFGANLQEIANLVERRGGQTLLLTAPSAISGESQERLRENGYLQFGDQAPRLHANYQQAVRLLDNEWDPQVLDVANIFAYISDPEILFYRDGIHLTDMGHIALAAVLVDHVRHHYLGDAAPVSHPAAVALV
ncbi:MAG: SGNH/GDSL hydrolase family protein, partial [bacterium]